MQTVGDQSRLVAPPGNGGAVALSRLGRRLREEEKVEVSLEGSRNEV